MLVAKRDPFHPRAHDIHHSHFDDGARPARAPGLSRTMSALQIFTTLLAIPLGIGSAYTMYRANFSPETTCQSLRASIVSMLDKGVDARTRHILVRRDVIAFEKSCGSVDPDATAAFKTLLASDEAAARRAEVKPPDQKPNEVARKVEAKPKPESEPRKAAVVEQRPAQHEALPDAAWLAAVRGALTPPEAEAAKPAASAPVAPNPSQPPAVLAERPLAREAYSKPGLRGSLPAPKLGVTPQPVPALPSANVASAPAAAADPDHPVPPRPFRSRSR